MIRTGDTDPLETREWLDALDGVLEFEGPDRAHFLLDRLVAEARRNGAPVPFSINTPYPHPTLSETIGMAAEMFEGSITDLIPPKRRH